MDRASIRSLYLDTLDGAALRPVAGDPDAALHAFLTLNAGYFLGERLSTDEHAQLVQRLAAGLDGLANLPLPSDTTHAAQLAQHVREIEDSFGRRPWTVALVRRTALLVPSLQEDWDELVRRAAVALKAGGDGHGLLLAHARRRLWELHNPVPTAVGEAPSVAQTLPDLSRAVKTADGHTIQVLEAVLAEAGANSALAPTLLPAHSGQQPVPSRDIDSQRRTGDLHSPPRGTPEGLFRVRSGARR
jgi:hypothetical protein